VRIALISMSGESAAAVRLAGRTLAWHQLLAALSLSCERIVCLADAPGPDLAALQREERVLPVGLGGARHRHAQLLHGHARLLLVGQEPGREGRREHPSEVADERRPHAAIGGSLRNISS